MSAHLFPTGFEDFARWSAWALPSERERYERRLRTPLDEVRAFHDALMPRVDDAMRLLQVQPADTAAIAEPVRRLFHLVLAWFEASTPVELNWRSSDLDDAFPADRIVYVGPSHAAD